MKKKMLVKLGAFIAICACAISTVQLNGLAAPAESNSPYMGLTAEQFEVYKMHVLRNMFDAKFFATQYPEIAAACGNDANKLFDYFVTEGLDKGLQPNANFDVAAYAVAYPDVANANGADMFSYYLHFYKFGSNEERTLTTKAACVEAGISVDIIENQQQNLESGKKVNVTEIMTSLGLKKAPVVSSVEKKSSGGNSKPAEVTVTKQTIQSEKSSEKILAETSSEVPAEVETPAEVPAEVETPAEVTDTPPVVVTDTPAEVTEVSPAEEKTPVEVTEVP